MLYIVGTPIGNLEDLSLRQAKTLASVDIILTEDTRSTGHLLKKIQELFALSLNPSQRLISYYKEKEFEKLPEILELLRLDKNIALISEGGMPLISDPGFLLLKEVIKQSIPYTIIPSPTAFTTALVHSGFPTTPSLFLGFLPKKTNEKKRLFERVKEIEKIIKNLTVVFYDSSHRIHDTLQHIDQIMPEANVCIARELTKKFEEVVRGKPKQLMQREYKGELTVVITLG